MFVPYPDYRRTDLKWFEHLPDSWAILRTKQMFRLVIEKAPANNKMELLSVYTHIGVRPRKSLEQRGNKASTTDGYWVVREGDMVCNKLLAWMGAIGSSHYQGVTSPAYDVLRPIKSCNADYYHFLFRTKKYLQQFKIRSRGIMDMRLRLYFDQFGQIPIPVPPRPEQDQIVAYLRAQDAHIARFIKAKRDLIKLLTEQKLRIIDHAVTRGLDSSVTLKPSGIEWLGEVPVHWEVVHIGSAVQIVNGYPFDSGLFDAAVGHPLVRIRDLNRTHTEVQFNGPEIREAVINTGDLIVGMDGDFNAARWRGGRALLNQRMCCLRPRKQITTEYLALVIPKALKFINDLTLSTTVKHLSSGDLKRLRFPIPGEIEQLQIVAYVEVETAPVNDAITRTEEEIKLIREYRDRLIADVVTGQVDVRGWRPGPDDVVDDAALAALGDDSEDVTDEEDGDGED